MSSEDNRTDAARRVEALVNEQMAAGHSPVELALTMLAAGADILSMAWDAPRALSAFDVLVEAIARRHSQGTAH
ncbi:hypothetical protein [Brevundimonas subvibrioides]|uniref:hypothetical protein n=1 Tax=Brevundimonas subvibrioides TaxID=74313 RepID=UPI0022B57D60|nr:hypothetical protein [Brevundimonas subvibrioides]